MKTFHYQQVYIDGDWIKTGTYEKREHALPMAAMIFESFPFNRSMFYDQSVTSPNMTLEQAGKLVSSTQEKE